MPKPYHVRDVARCVLKHQTEAEKESSINPELKLHKLLYFLQAQSIKEDGKPLFLEPIKAADFGPVVDSIFGQYGFLKLQSTPHYRDTIPNLNPIELKDEVLIKEIVDGFASYSNLQLSNIIRGQQPWKDAYANNRNISNKDLKNYFSEPEKQKIIKAWTPPNIFNNPTKNQKKEVNHER